MLTGAHRKVLLMLWLVFVIDASPKQIFVLFNSAQSISLAYGELSVEAKKRDEKMKNLDPKKKEQMERRGMGNTGTRYAWKLVAVHDDKIDGFILALSLMALQPNVSLLPIVGNFSHDCWALTACHLFRLSDVPFIPGVTEESLSSLNSDSTAMLFQLVS